VEFHTGAVAVRFLRQISMIPVSNCPFHGVWSDCTVSAAGMSVDVFSNSLVQWHLKNKSKGFSKKKSDMLPSRLKFSGYDF
jgi:hypothetical protein